MLTKKSGRSNLPNGHLTKESTLDSSSPLVTSTQATSTHNVESTKANGIKWPQHERESSQLTSNYQSSPVESEKVADHETGNASENPLDDRSPIMIDRVEDSEPVNSTPAVVQPSTSDTGSEPHLTNQQTLIATEQENQLHPPNPEQHVNGAQSSELDFAPGTIAPSTNQGPDVQTEHVDAKAVADSTTKPAETAMTAVSMSVAPNNRIPSNLDLDAHPEDHTDLPHHLPTLISEGGKSEAPTTLDTPPPSLPIAPSVPDDQHASGDLEMKDSPLSSAKVAREREEDDQHDEPVPKRSKTTGDDSSAGDFKVPVLPQLATDLNNASARTNSEASQPITKPQQKFMLKVLQNIKRLNDALPFVKPVDPVALNIPSYPTIITNPMDLKTMEDKLKSDLYPSTLTFVEDFGLIVQNSITFNGLEHVVTRNAQNIKASFDKQLTNLPGPEIVDATPVEKKKKASVSSSTVKAPSRRESRSSLPGSARSPVTTASPTTFALGPQGVPLIRRDSTVGDGRPKREIHPPAPRDLPYASQKPKKKKYQLELKFCQTVVTELSKPKYSSIAFPFMLPVDPVALNIPHYHKLIKQPMDLSTISSKLNHGQYENAREFEADVRLMFSNCYKFNPPSDPVHGMGKQFEGVFDDKWKEKAAWIEANTPSSGPQSPATSSEAEDDDDEEDEEEEEEPQDQISKLKQQIAAMSKQVELIEEKKKKSPPATSKKAKGTKSAKEKGKKRPAAPAPKVEKKAPKATKKEKPHYISYERKRDISNRINSLPEGKMASALKIIRDHMPNLTVGALLSASLYREYIDRLLL